MHNPGKIRLKRTKVGIHTWHTTADSRFTIKPTQWAPGNPHRPTSFVVIDANKPGVEYPMSRLEDGRRFIATILEQEAASSPTEPKPGATSK